MADSDKDADGAALKATRKVCRAPEVAWGMLAPCVSLISRRPTFVELRIPRDIEVKKKSRNRMRLAVMFKIMRMDKRIKKYHNITG